ncbi:MAG: glycine dehydrogenase, partial [Deltaproteobacteria bacterium]|nr:glycine dehydrogenase [Deltaproteobacteria bacterium]
MRYLPHTSEDITSMLQIVGVDHLDDLFRSIPEDCRCKDKLNLPEPV